MSNRIEDVKDEDIFVSTNALTNQIKGKKLRKKLLDNRIKVKIWKDTDYNEILPMVRVPYHTLTFEYHRPKGMDKELMNEIVDEVSDVLFRKYDHGHRFSYVDIDEVPKLQCNYCGMKFNQGMQHECDYDRLREMNAELKSLAQWAIRRLPKGRHKENAYDDYDKITGEEVERL